jgi:hypothetical protein
MVLTYHIYDSWFRAPEFVATQEMSVVNGVRGTLTAFLGAVLIEMYREITVRIVMAGIDLAHRVKARVGELSVSSERRWRNGTGVNASAYRTVGVGETGWQIRNGSRSDRYVTAQS